VADLAEIARPIPSLLDERGVALPFSLEGVEIEDIDSEARLGKILSDLRSPMFAKEDQVFHAIGRSIHVMVSSDALNLREAEYWLC
jgi:hypothetical protein